MIAKHSELFRIVKICKMQLMNQKMVIPQQQAISDVSDSCYCDNPAPENTT